MATSLQEWRDLLPGYTSYWTCSTLKKGYAGYAGLGWDRVASWQTGAMQCTGAMQRPGPAMQRTGPAMQRTGPAMQRPGPAMQRTGTAATR